MQIHAFAKQTLYDTKPVSQDEKHLTVFFNPQGLSTQINKCFWELIMIYIIGSLPFKIIFCTRKLGVKIDEVEKMPYYLNEELLLGPHVLLIFVLLLMIMCSISCPALYTTDVICDI